MLKSKNVRRTIALMLCLIMMMSVASFAVGEVSNELLPLSVVQFFAEQGYDISRTARMELVQNNSRTSVYGLNSSTDDPIYSLRITERNGNQISVYYTILLVKNDDGTYEHDDSIIEYMTRAVGDPINGGSDVIANKIALTASTSYTTGIIQTVATVYKPTGLSFSYSTYSQCNVGSISVTYTTKGTAYSGLNSTTPVAYNYRYPITKTVSVPEAGYIYSTSSPCPYYIDTAYGGMALTYIVKIDGGTYNGDLT